MLTRAGKYMSLAVLFTLSNHHASLFWQWAWIVYAFNQARTGWRDVEHMVALLTKDSYQLRLYQLEIAIDQFLATLHKWSRQKYIDLDVNLWMIILDWVCLARQWSDEATVVAIFSSGAMKSAQFLTTIAWRRFWSRKQPGADEVPRVESHLSIVAYHTRHLVTHANLFQPDADPPSIKHCAIQ